MHGRRCSWVAGGAAGALCCLRARTRACTHAGAASLTQRRIISDHARLSSSYSTATSNRMRPPLSTRSRHSSCGQGRSNRPGVGIAAAEAACGLEGSWLADTRRVTCARHRHCACRSTPPVPKGVHARLVQPAHGPPCHTYGIPAVPVQGRPQTASWRRGSVPRARCQLCAAAQSPAACSRGRGGQTATPVYTSAAGTDSSTA
jgi:hypothetical protein